MTAEIKQVGFTEEESPLQFSPMIDIKPKTERTKQLEKLREAKELEEREAKEQEVRNREEREKRRLAMEREMQKREQARRRKEEEEEKKKKEEDEHKKDLDPKLGKFINQLNKNITDFDKSLSDVNLNPVNFRILAKSLGKNQSLISLSITRKALSDEEGALLGESLNTNISLKRLECEGNNLGSKAARMLGEALLINKTLKVLDLENNNLTDNGSNPKGIEAIAEGLKQNNTLIVLNLYGNLISEQGAISLLSALKINTRLLQLELGLSKDIKLETLTDIQNCLERNKQNYDKERFKEFEERSKMRNEEDATKTTVMKQEKNQIEQTGILERSKQRYEIRLEKDAEILEEYDLKWKEEVERTRQNAINKADAFNKKKKAGKKKTRK